MKYVLIISLLFFSSLSKSQEFIQKWKNHINTGKTFYISEKYSSAMDEFKQAAKLIPTDTLAYNYIINCAQFTKQAREAYDAITKLEKIEINSPQVYLTSIPILIANNYATEKVFKVLSSAKNKFPNNQELKYISFQFYSKYNLSTIFLDNIDSYLSDYPNDYKAYLLYIKVLEEQKNDSVKSFSIIKNAENIFPDSLSFFKMEYSYYLKNKEFDKAQDLIESLLKEKTQDPELYYNLALLYFEKEEYEQSAEICKKAIELKPDYVEALYNVGTFYYYQGLLYNSALSDMTVEQYKTQGKEFQELALQYFREAKPYFEKAQKINNTDLDTYENLNTISILIENLESNKSLDYNWDEEIVNKHALDISNITVNYENSNNILKDNSKARLKFMLSNTGDSLLTNIKILINQPITTEGLSYEKNLFIDSLGINESLGLNIELKYNYKDGSVAGIEEAEGAQDKLRIYAKSNRLKISDLMEVKLNIQKNLANNYISSSEDLNFTPADVSNNFLIVIGINDYEYWDTLHNAVIDAVSFKNVLINEYGFKPELCYQLLNSEATHAALRNTLIKIKREITVNDNLIIYYAGHGFYDKEFDNGSWIPYDAHYGNTTEYLPSALLIKYLSNIPAKHSVIIADACFSGSLFIQDQNYKYEPGNDKIASRWGFSSGNLEYVADGNNGIGSPFASSLINFLANNKSKKLPISKLIESVSKEVRNTTQQNPIGRPLAIPGNNGGEFVFYKLK